MPAPVNIAGTTDSVAVALSATDHEGLMRIYAFNRTTGGLLWGQTCLSRCTVTMLDSHTLILHEVRPCLLF